MVEKNKDSALRGELAPLRQKTGDFLERSLAQLPEEKQQALIGKAIEERLELDRKMQEAYHDVDVSREEMHDAARHSETLSRSRTDFKAEYEGKTSTGNWKLQVQRSNTMLVVIIAVVIGLVAILALN